MTNPATRFSWSADLCEGPLFAGRPPETGFFNELVAVFLGVLFKLRIPVLRRFKASGLVRFLTPLGL